MTLPASTSSELLKVSLGLLRVPPSGGAGAACDGHAQRPKERMRGRSRHSSSSWGGKKNRWPCAEDQKCVPEKENRTRYPFSGKKVDSNV